MNDCFLYAALHWKVIPSKKKPELEKWIQQQKEKYYWVENNAELLYCIKNNILELPTCLIEECNKKRRFVSVTQGYRNGCSKKHNTLLTCRAKYNCDNPFQDKNIREKFKKTCLERYGASSYVASSYFHETIDIHKVAKKANKIAAKKNLEKYGVEYPFQSQQIQNKVKKTNLEKYGFITPLLNEDVKNKTIKTNLERYGTEHHFSNSNIQDIIKKTNLKKYGNENPSKAKQIKENKYKQTYFNKINNISELKLLCTENEFVGVKKNYYTWKCKTCSITFKDHLRNGNIPICPKCNNKTRSNMEEEFINEVLSNYSFVKNYLKFTFENGKRFELDFLIENKLAIELNGNFWHSEIGGMKSKYYHLNKTIQCLKNKIPLIHIFEDEWIFKREIVKSLIHSKLGNFKNTISSNECIINQVSSKEKNNFLEKNHLKGKDKSPIKIGLFFNNELVSILTLKSIIGKNNQYKISRYCNLLNHNVEGGFNKLLEYFKNEYNPNSIISFVDKRLSEGITLINESFVKIKEYEPNFYLTFKNRLNRIQNFKFEKTILENYDEHLTEWENLKNHGYDRIWDCGYVLFEWKKDIPY